MKHTTGVQAIFPPVIFIFDMRVYACVCVYRGGGGGGGKWKAVIMTWKCGGDESVPTVFYN